MKKLSLKLKLYVFVMLLLLLMGLAMIITAQVSLSGMKDNISTDTRELVQDIVVQRLKATAGQYGEQVSGLFNEAFKVPQTFIEIIEGNIEASSSERMSRRGMSQTVGSILEGQPRLSAIYAQLEPDAYDGQDRYFTGGVEEHSSDEGVLEIRYTRNRDGNIHFSRPAAKYDDTTNQYGIRKSEWYLCPRDRVAPCMLEPYKAKTDGGGSKLMTSLVMPIRKGGDFAGVLGVDLDLSTVQQTLLEVSEHLYDGAGRVTLISNKGLIAGSSDYQGFLGQPLANALPERAKAYEALNGDDRVYTNDNEIVVSFPVHVDVSGTTWNMIVELPRDVALANLVDVNNLLSDHVSSTQSRQITVGIVVSLIAIVLLILLVRSVTRPLDRIRDRMINLASAEGDLTRELTIETHSELIALADGFNAFLAKLRDMVNDLKNINRQVGGQVADVRSIATDTEDSTERQHLEIDSVVTAMNEMSATANEVANFASEAADNARNASSGVETTQNTLTTAVAGVQALATDMEQASSAIGHVAERSDDINRILEVIRGIAEQTNLLALNAAIEAARAGEQGRGFAVVADEVRTLASKTRESTDEISGMIDGLQHEVRQTVAVIRGGVDRAASAVESTQEADRALAEVVSRIATIVEHVTQVATAAEEQSSVSEEINRNLTNIGDAASNLRELARRVRSSGETLGEQTESQDVQLQRLRT